MLPVVLRIAAHDQEAAIRKSPFMRRGSMVVFIRRHDERSLCAQAQTGYDFVLFCITMLSDVFLTAFIEVEHDVIELFFQKFFHSFLNFLEERGVIVMELNGMPEYLTVRFLSEA